MSGGGKVRPWKRWTPAERAIVADNLHLADHKIAAMMPKRNGHQVREYRKRAGLVKVRGNKIGNMNCNTPELRARIVELYASGKTGPQIGVIVCRGNGSVYYHLDMAGVQMRPRSTRGTEDSNAQD